jgi:serine/threonine protein kinase/Tol biopolymer transport system component
LTGQTIGHYCVLERLGEGGMGVVWKARDVRLDRLVAIKMLPPERTRDPDRRARFIREARAASALNHPNIITIHEIGSEGDVDFLVMELISGKTLDHLTPAGGMRLGDALKYGVQIADALAAAHRAGIVHRDLKPGNIMVTESGLAKVLDFGLAKLTEPAIGADDATRTLRADGPVTAEGIAVGTYAYMSPEQAEGRKVDARSDIFSFGIVLYHMLTGRNPFQKASRLATLSAIAGEELKPLGEVAPGAPPELERVVARCLRKDPEYRFQHMDDLKVALRELKEESDSGKLATLAPAQRRQNRKVLWAAAAVLFAVAAGAFYFTRQQSVPAVAHPLVRLTSDAGLSFEPALSRDGTLLAFASDRSGAGNLDIWVKQTAGGEPVRVTRDMADAHQPSFSPDGSKIVFRSERGRGGIYVIPALGGDARKLVDGGRSPLFSPDGSWIAYWENVQNGNQMAIFILPSTGGTPRQLAADFQFAQAPFWVGDSRHLAFLGGARYADSPDLWVTPIDGGAPVKTGLQAARAARNLVVGQGPGSGATLTKGDSVHFIFPARSGDSVNLWKAPLSPRTWQVDGPLERITFGSADESAPSLASDGRLAFAAMASNSDVWSLPVDTDRARVTGELARLTTDPATDFYPTVSYNGRRVAFLSARGRGVEVWLKDLDTGKEEPVPGAERPRFPIISPGGEKIALAVQSGIVTAPLGGGAAEPVCPGGKRPLSWSPDGATLLVDPGAVRAEALICNPTTSQSTPLLRLPDKSIHSAQFSRDGRWIAFHVATSPVTRRVYVVRYQGPRLHPENEWIAVSDGRAMDREPRWSPGGDMLYFLSTRDGYNCIWAQRLDRETRRAVGEAVAILHLHTGRRSLITADTGPIGLSVTPDHIVFSMPERTANIWMTRLSD